MVLPFDQHSITFDDIIYSVDMPQVTQVINISAFVSGVKRIWKIFSTNRGDWFGLKTKLNEKSFSLTIKYEELKCKIDYTSILPSNHFQKKKGKKNQTKRERAAHYQRERGRSLELEIDSVASRLNPDASLSSFFSQFDQI